jgi:hypothetical protein
MKSHLTVPWDRYKAVFDRSAGLQDRNVKKAQEIAELKAEVERLREFKSWAVGNMTAPQFSKFEEWKAQKGGE